MYFIAKGDCVVKIKDRLKDGVFEIKHASLNPGDHFGVIIWSLIVNRKLDYCMVAPEQHL